MSEIGFNSFGLGIIDLSLKIRQIHLFPEEVEGVGKYGVAGLGSDHRVDHFEVQLVEGVFDVGRVQKLDFLVKVAQDGQLLLPDELDAELVGQKRVDDRLEVAQLGLHVELQLEKDVVEVQLERLGLAQGHEVGDLQEAEALDEVLVHQQKFLVSAFEKMGRTLDQGRVELVPVVEQRVANHVRKDVEHRPVDGLRPQRFLQKIRVQKFNLEVTFREPTFN